MGEMVASSAFSIFARIVNECIGHAKAHGPAALPEKLAKSPGGFSFEKSMGVCAAARHSRRIENCASTSDSTRRGVGESESSSEVSSRILATRDFFSTRDREIVFCVYSVDSVNRLNTTKSR